MNPAPRRARAWWLLALVVFVAFWDLAGRNLHEVDTSRWGQLAREMVRSGEWLVPTRYGEVYANKPPLYLWAVAGPSAIAGEVTPFWVRLPSALGLIVLVLSAAWWARMRTGSRTVGRLTGLLLLSTFGIAEMGRAGRLDMMGAGLATLGTVLLDRAALGQGTRKTAWWAGLWLGLAVLTKGPPLLLVPAVLLFAPSGGHRLGERLRNARPLVVLGVTVGVALAWFVPALIEGGWSYGRALLLQQAADRFSGAAQSVKPFYYYALGTPIGAFPWGLFYVAVVLAVFVPRWRRSLGPTGGVAVAAMIVLAIFSAIPTKHFRYLVPVVPLLAMPLAFWIARWLERPPRLEWPVHLRRLMWALGLSALGIAITGVFAPRGLLPALVPAMALGLTCLAAREGLGSRDDSGAHQRRRLVTILLCAAALWILAFNVLRPRFYDGPKERFNRILAELREPDVPVFIGPGMSKESVFHGAPHARFPFDAAKPVPVPAGGKALVVCKVAETKAVLAVNPRPGKVLLTVGGRYQYAIVGFGFP